MGSNLGDRAGNLLLAVRGMLDVGLVLNRLSAVYETEALEKLSQSLSPEMPPFLNMVAELRTPLPEPEQLLGRLLRIEYALGRTRETPGGPRTIDLDLLICGDQVRETEFLMLPHPRLHLRRFVLAPLAELAPQLIHPTLHKPVSELLTAVGGDGTLKRWEPTTS
ncbi:MAG: 2-amino-4-hydroxy-6-hydroxymethyldihydropteridine diphosphokinase [Blastocatellia bacterium]|jgi:2-amino-4-hydroxy-6-hydroxymethyldihydropteridine diphosphokinase|nr:2-amino-4-hydroxy-6-hydroxymethyldihydropteridine diphosphokinase [Blastocatellia bacterium]